MERERPNMNPVSYTHLDVYKRQVRGLGHDALGLFDGRGGILHTTGQALTACRGTTGFVAGLLGLNARRAKTGQHFP